jgi:hypothetical protein
MKSQSNYPLNEKIPLEHTLATRVSSEELSDIRAAAMSRGVTNSQWLRSAAMAYLNRDGAFQSTPLESVVLAEVMCLRMILLNLFANLGLPTATLHFVMRNANLVKHSEVARVLRETKWDSDSSTHARGVQETS